MRIGVLSDIHANIQALQAVLKDCQEQRVDKFWLLGDYVDYGGDPVETVSELSKLGAEYMIAGNHDACLYTSSVRSSETPHGKQAFEYTKEIVKENRERFRLLEVIADKPLLHLADRKTLLVHGTPQDPYWGKFLPGDNADVLFDVLEQMDVRMMLLGHSHVSFMLTRGGRTIINPGSVGQPRDGCPKAAYGILDGDAVIFRRVQYDMDGAAKAIQEAGLPEYLWKRLYKGA